MISMKNKYTAFEWVKKIIDSCITHAHYMRCRQLMENFNKLYRDDGLYELLDDKLDGLRQSGALLLPSGSYTWEKHRPPKPEARMKCICDSIREHGGSGWCHIHHTDWI